MQVLLIDGFNLIRRIFEARPHDDALLQQEVIVSATQSIGRAVRKFKPTHICCVFDSHDKSWRHLLYPEYKKNRKPTPALLLDALPRFEESFMEAGIHCLMVPGYEADDVIATLARKIEGAGGTVFILSTDKGFMQLLSSQIRLFDHFHDLEIDRYAVSEKFGVSCEQLLDYWALTGDPTNNIKGVAGIGSKTAQRLLEEYKTLGAILANPPPGRVGKLISGKVKEATISRQLIALKTDVEVGINLKLLRYNAPEIDELPPRS